eukprot:CAMPEP_0204288842 /NCGR_PEP_ID=MMETSP0468-20130131/57529_1 /ASSEMBLY_ACC=CAM_ASM_000383 /TAXON_ID=2969 /ORGANISM="Oxyrrhis marina" /LENGTH=83 /DNA_ID=CAMNT_0051266961 /DNA_START=1 /DNA_END=248 /DNA_ORIENTATION=+
MQHRWLHWWRVHRVPPTARTRVPRLSTHPRWWVRLPQTARTQVPRLSTHPRWSHSERGHSYLLLQAADRPPAPRALQTADRGS